ncbi:GntR family transcriptional regulator [Hominifimenecus sp. rT4P-3]|uniref:GntR family transcriptional regulator n=1 Tax=Hominifimenecus sp. rT4P-3 TaxID=3242979 RepID=UPI003DA62F1B
MKDLAKPLTNRERIAQILRKGIYSGTFHPGQELVQNTIATQLGVSRMPVREAIYILLKEGLVEHIPNRGFFVKNITRAFFEDYFFIRTLFEQKAVSYICKTLEDSSVLQEFLVGEQNAYERQDVPALSQYTNRLQNYIGSHCGSPRLSTYLQQLWDMSPRRISADSGQQVLFIDSTFQYHQSLVKAILKNEEETACRLIANHLELSKTHYFSIRDELHLDEE